MWNPIEVIGIFLIDKYRAQAAASGRQAAARNMRKQGYPLNIALLVLGRV